MDAIRACVDALRASVAARVERLRASLAAAGLTDASDALSMAGLPVPAGPPSPQGTAKFLARADTFLGALEIALQVRQTHAQPVYRHMSLERFSVQVEHIASGSVRTLAQLRYLEENFLVFWNEGTDSETRPFWEQVQAQGLPYQRVDHLSKILTRGRIASRTEYEYAVDVIVLAQQDGSLTHTDAVRLAQMIGDYERKRR